MLLFWKENYWTNFGFEISAVLKFLKMEVWLLSKKRGIKDFYGFHGSQVLLHHIPICCMLGNQTACRGRVLCLTSRRREGGIDPHHLRAVVEWSNHPFGYARLVVIIIKTILMAHCQCCLPFFRDNFENQFFLFKLQHSTYRLWELSEL